MNFDLYDYFVASVDGTLSSMPQISWTNQFAVCVVLASEGYPESYAKTKKFLDLILFQMVHTFFMLEQKRLMEKSFQMEGVFWV
jgi:phosphoribosylamine-glycine ligase